MSSPRSAARLAGALYLLSVLTAVSGEAFSRGSVAYAAGLVAIALYVAVTLFTFEVFRPAGRGLAALAAGSNLANLSFEALRLHPRGVNVALAFYGFHCLLVGILALRSTFLPRVLGVLMGLGGLAWLTNLSRSLTTRLAPYNVAVGFLGVGSLMLWLLIRTVDARRWTEQARAAGTT